MKRCLLESCVACLRTNFAFDASDGVEPHHRFPKQGTVLRRPEGQDVNALDGAADVTAKRGHGIGEAGAVHVDVHAVAVCDLGQRGELRRLPHGPDLGALADAHDPWLHVVLVADDMQLRLDLRGLEAPVRRRERHQRRPGEARRCPALVDEDVREARAQHRLVRLQQRGQADDVGTRCR